MQTHRAGVHQVRTDKPRHHNNNNQKEPSAAASHALFCVIAELSGNSSWGQISFASLISLSPHGGRSRVLILISISLLLGCTAPPGGHLSIKGEVRQTVMSLCSACWTAATLPPHRTLSTPTPGPAPTHSVRFSFQLIRV